MPQLPSAEFAEWDYKNTVHVLEMEGKTEVVGWLKIMKERELDISDVEELIRKCENVEQQHAEVVSILNSIGLFVSKEAKGYEAPLLWSRFMIEYLQYRMKKSFFNGYSAGVDLRK